MFGQVYLLLGHFDPEKKSLDLLFFIWIEEMQEMVFMVDYHFWEFLRICKTFGKFRAGVKTAKFSRFSCSTR